MGKHPGDLISSLLHPHPHPHPHHQHPHPPRNEVAEQVVVACMFTHHFTVSANHATSCYDTIKAKANTAKSILHDYIRTTL
ncbi:hypothetical protein ACSBR1_029869 [Camellia fascicularis]